MKSLLVLTVLMVSQFSLANDYPCGVTSKHLDHRVEIAHQEVDATSEAAAIIEGLMTHITSEAEINNETTEGFTYVPSKNMQFLTYSFRNLKAAEKVEEALRKADKCY